MISAKKILEEYYGLYKPSWTSEPVPLFRNPDRKEMSECGEFIRFFADAATKEVFVWNGKKALHGDMLRHGLLRSISSLKESEIKGEATREGAIWKVDVGELKYAYRSNPLLKLFQNYDWSWLTRYRIDMEAAQREILDLWGVA